MAFGTHEIVNMFFSLGLLLTLARVMGEIARKMNQPSVLGEILAGILLGPTVLGTLFPEIEQAIFPAQGVNPLVLKAMATLAVVLFLLVAGMELDLSAILRQGRTAALVSLLGIVVPFVLGFGAAFGVPTAFGADVTSNRLIFSLFIATAMSISALPVIARTLMDLSLYKSDFGMLIVAAAIVNDLAGWIIFAILLAMMGGAAHSHSIPFTVGLTLGFALFMLTVGRWAIHRLLPWIQAYMSWPGGVLGFALSLALFGAAFTEWIGVHAIFGSFLVGVAVGDSSHLREHTRTTIERFISFFFAPLFFAWIGLQVDFVRNFDLPLVLIVMVIACAGKILGCMWAGRMAKMPRNEAWALGVAMNSRGMMEIILGHLALQNGLIQERTFVALVVMALVTSTMTGPLMQRLLKSPRPLRLLDCLSTKTFKLNLTAQTREEAIHELIGQIGELPELSIETLETAVMIRERIMATGLSGGIAVPHARLAQLKAPIVAVGLAPHGIDFDAPDGEPAHIICLLLTPQHDQGAQLQILADIARSFSDEKFRDRIMRIGTFTELLALLKSQPAPHAG
jgi:Kef-type K+ transport system membrane component KefB/mannitol/fructose-specific phosphotransferase system IIA component (Ntr-type)